MLFLVQMMNASGSGFYEMKNHALAVGDDVSQYVDGIFIENEGQFRDGISFMSRTSFGSVGLSGGSIYYNLMTSNIGDIEGGMMEGMIVEVEFVDSNDVIPEGEGLVETRFNYILGNDPARWISGVNGYVSVYYRNIWDGVDLRFHGAGGKLKYDLILDSGADHHDIKMKVSGVEELVVEGGSLKMIVDGSISVIDDNLRIFYKDCGEELDAAFRTDRLSYGFDIEEYDQSRSIVIDPEVNADLLHYSTYIGGSMVDYVDRIDIDSMGNVYIGGGSISGDFPVTAGAYQKKIKGNSGDMAVAKLSADGKKLDFCTFIGGSDSESLSDIRVDGSGSCFLIGQTYSNDFPVTDDAYQKKKNGDPSDLFVLKLNSSGDSLLHSTYFGGSSYESSGFIDIDESGLVFGSAVTLSSDLPVTDDAFQKEMTIDPDWGSGDMSIFIMDLDKMELKHCTYLGGSGSETPEGVHLGSGNTLFVAGGTTSRDFNVTDDAYSTSLSGMLDAFILKYNLTSKDLDFSTYIGGSNITSVYDIDIDSRGNPFICGKTNSGDHPLTRGVFDTKLTDQYDGFISGVDSTGKKLVLSTYAGGNCSEILKSIKMDAEDNIHVFGQAMGPSDFPVLEGCLQDWYGGGSSDCVYLKLDPNGSSLLYSTFIGGCNAEYGMDLAIDSSVGEPVLAGTTFSDDFPVKTGSFDTSFNGPDETDQDMFVMRLNLTIAPGKPLDLRGVAGNGFVNLSWKRPNNDDTAAATDFEILRGESRTTMTPIGRTGGRLYYNDTTVENGVTYYYSAAAIRGIITGGISDIAEFTPFSIPGIPTDFRASYGDRRVDIFWSEPLDDGGFKIEEYRLVRIDPIGGPMTWILGGMKRDFSDTEVQNGMEYSYRMKAVNEHGESDPTPFLNITPMTVPDAPVNLTAASGPEYVKINWEKPEADGGSPILNYAISRCLHSEWQEYETVDADVLEFNDTDVENGVLCSYRITAGNKEGWSAFSNVVEAIPLEIPSPPRNLKVELLVGSLNISWEEPESDGGSSITGYNVYRKGNDGWILMRTVSGSSLNMIDVDVVTSVVYSYRVTAVNSVGESPCSDEASASPVSRPSRVYGLDGRSGDGFVHLNWMIPDDGGSDIRTFRIYRCTLNSGMEFLSEVNAGLNEFNDSSTVNGISYRYMVIAVNDLGDSDPSDEIILRPAGLSDPPENIIIESSDSLVSVSWKIPENTGGIDLTGIRLFRGEGDKEPILIGTIDPDRTTYIDDDVSNGNTYSYSLSCVNELGEGAWSNIFEAVPSGLPSVPTELCVVLEDGMINLSWLPPEDSGGIEIIGYNVYREDAGDLPIAELDGETLYHLDIEVVEGRYYSYQVEAVNMNGKGPLSEPVSFSISMPEEDHEEGGVGLIILLIAGLLVLIFLILGCVVLILIRKKRSGKRELIPDPVAPIGTSGMGMGSSDPLSFISDNGYGVNDEFDNYRH
ncbi:MAG: fibronectin type III domain-containing protein [Thermoplasmatota archaeon]